MQDIFLGKDLFKLKKCVSLSSSSNVFFGFVGQNAMSYIALETNSTTQIRYRTQYLKVISNEKIVSKTNP